jgi:putative restriction endonuclease
MDRDSRIRVQAFEFLDALRSRQGDALPREELLRGFDVDGERVPLLGPQGIFKPRVLSEVPLSITTAPIQEGKPRPYEDEVGKDGLIRYRYRGTDPQHHENVGLRRAMSNRIPLIYFVGLVPGRYAAEYPAFIVGDDPSTLSFSVAIDDPMAIRGPASLVADGSTAARRSYITAAAQHRVHQQGFRERVLSAYEQCCAVCRLRHRPLLDAAHILPDSHPKGEPWVSNGIALCKIHHAAYDSDILGIRADLVVIIRKDVLEEHDGPMLTHGLQQLHSRPLALVPRSAALRPNPEFLEVRFEQFSRQGRT